MNTSWIKKCAVAMTMSAALATGALADTLVVGGKNFTEQQILTSMTTQYLKSKGYDISSRAGMGSALLRSAQENGQIDLYWEYTGTSLVVYNGVNESLNREETYQRVKSLDEQKGLIWLNPSDANNTYALAMRKSDTVSSGIITLSDFAKAINDGEELVLASNAEWYAREDGYRPFSEAYDFKLSRNQIKKMDSGLTYTALKEGQVDAALVFATDGRIPAFDFVILEDDKGFFPDYAITPVVRAETLSEYPDLASELNALSAVIDNDSMSALNAQVDVERRDIDEVARRFLEGKGFI